MRRTTKFALVSVLGTAAWISSLTCQAALIGYNLGVPRIPATRTYQSPVIDGQLNDDCWKKAGISTNFASYSGNGLSKDQTTVYTTYDKEKLYIAFRCAEPHPEKLTTTAGKRDDPVWEDDSVELFLDTGNDHESYFHLAVNSAGVQYDAERGTGRLGRDWNGTWEVKTSAGADYWECEIAIPFSELKSGSPKTGTIWGFNAARNQHAANESSNWAGISGNAHQPSKFGELVFSEMPITAYCKSAGPMFYGSNPMTVEVNNQTGAPQVVGLDVDVVTGSESKSHTGQRLLLRKDELRDISFNYDIRDGDYLVVEIANKDTGEVYQRDRYAIHLPSPRIQDVRSQINELDNIALKQAGDKNPRLTQQLKLLSTGIHSKLDELQQTVNGYIKAKAVIENENWQKRKVELDKYCERVRALSDILWSQSPWITPSSSDLPDSSAGMDAIDLTLCVNEHKSSVIEITNLLGSEISGRLVLSDLVENTNRAGARKQIGKEQITVRNVVNRIQRDGSSIPDALPRANEINEVRIPAGSTTQMWLTINSRDAIPGSYTGTVTFKPFNRSTLSKTLQLNVTILPIKLPEKLPISTYTWDYTSTDSYVKDLAEHRINTFLLPAPLPELDKNGSLVKSGNYNCTELQVKRDFGQLMYSYGIIESYDEYVKHQFNWQFMDENWKKGFKNWITDWMAGLKQIGIGYTDFSVQLWDEPAGAEVNKVVKAGAFLREIDPNIRTIMNPSLDTTLDDMKQMAPYVDLWIPLTEHIQKASCPNAQAELDFLKSTGKPIWTYTCNVNMPTLSAIGYYRLKPWRTWDLGLSGCALWAYNSWRGDSWDDFDGPKDQSDNGMVYSGDYGPIPTRRWEAFREGLDDYLTLHLLNASIAKGKTQRIEMNMLLTAQDTLNKIVPEVLEGAEKNPALIDEAREKITRNILDLNRLMSFAAKTPSVESHEGDSVIKWVTTEPSVGTVYYRKRGSAAWQAVTSLSSETNHALTLSGLRSGVDYDYFTESVNDVGLIRVDDNNSAYYSFHQ